ncbi:MAG TPA: hypothetical protein VH143_20420 [Kofleriaceae bacterium]|jgi:hypothetical protein|nr:hypothetical protein [Kofleriaceae bacterium]
MKSLAMVWLIGCAGSSPPPPVAPQPDPTAACDQAVGHLVGQVTPDPLGDDERAQIRHVSAHVVQHCVADGWSATTLKCLNDAATHAAAQACAGTLTAAQLHALGDADGPRRSADPHELAVIAVKQYAFEAYPRWAVEHPDQACPGALAELRELTSFDSDLDPWGHPYRVLCGASLPAGVKGLGVQSAGPDGQLDTADDVRSWD